MTDPAVELRLINDGATIESAQMKAVEFGITPLIGGRAVVGGRLKYRRRKLAEGKDHVISLVLPDGTEEGVYRGTLFATYNERLITSTDLVLTLVDTGVDRLVADGAPTPVVAS